MTKITRRTTTGLLLAGCLAPGAVLVANKYRANLPSPQPDLAERLAQELNNRLGARANGSFTVQTFDRVTQQGKTTLSTTVRLDWAPGQRQRAARSTGASEEEAFSNLVSAAIDRFDSVWPAQDA